MEQKLQEWIGAVGGKCSLEFVLKDPPSGKTSIDLSDPWWKAFSSACSKQWVQGTCTLNMRWLSWFPPARNITSIETEIFSAATDSRYIRRVSSGHIGFITYTYSFFSLAIPPAQYPCTWVLSHQKHTNPSPWPQRISEHKNIPRGHWHLPRHYCKSGKCQIIIIRKKRKISVCSSMIGDYSFYACCFHCLRTTYPLALDSEGGTFVACHTLLVSVKVWLYCLKHFLLGI